MAGKGRQLGRFKRGCAWLLGLVALTWFTIAIFQNHLASVQRKRDQALARDWVLDHSFNARPTAPLEVYVMISTAEGGYQVPADQPSFRQHIASLGKLPAIVVLSGCGFPVWGKDVPLNAAVLSVREDPDLIGAKTSVEACIAKDGAAIELAYEQQIRFITEYVKRATWIDKDRVMIAGYGEAAPLVARYPGPAKQRLTLGDPCLVHWNNISRKSPILMLFTSDRQGLMREDEPKRPFDLVAIAKGAGPSFPRVTHCVGLPRPSIRSSARQIVASGQLDVFERPIALLAAQKGAYDDL